MAGNRSGWRGMVRALKGVERDGEPYFRRVAPVVLRANERDWPSVVWARDGGAPVSSFEGQSLRPTVMLTFLAGTFLEAEAARETGLAALEREHLLAAPPDPPYDLFEEDLAAGVGTEDDNGGAFADQGCFAVVQEVVLR